MGHSSTATLGRYRYPSLAGMADAINSRNAKIAEKVTTESQLEIASEVVNVSS